MEYCCVDDYFPEWRMFLEFYDDSFCTAYYDDSLKSTHPIEVPVKYPDEIDQIFSGKSLTGAVKFDKRYSSLVAEGMNTYNEILEQERMK